MKAEYVTPFRASLMEFWRKALTGSYGEIPENPTDHQKEVMRLLGIPEKEKEIPTA